MMNEGAEQNRMKIAAKDTDIIAIVNAIQGGNLGEDTGTPTTMGFWDISVS
jgi:hypothetical protein